ncbi:MAG: hypothetical protein AAGK22_12230 [Acidobacteriota bacterium]
MRLILLRFPLLALVSVLGWSADAAAQSPTITVQDVPCLLVLENGVIEANVQNNVPETTARLYFRRLHEAVEDFYWVEMRPRGDGRYWGVLPKAEDEVLERREVRELEEEVRERWANWWREKERLDNRNPNLELDQALIDERASIGRRARRDWMADFDDARLEEWLDGLEYEPAEYFAALHDAFGNEISRSPVRVTRVTDRCDTNLSAAEAGLAENLTIGETAPWQEGEEVFHWMCDGVVSRVDASGVFRGDSICRACLVAWWQKETFLTPLVAGAGTNGVIALEPEEPASPVRP